MKTKTIAPNDATWKSAVSPDPRVHLNIKFEPHYVVSSEQMLKTVIMKQNNNYKSVFWLHKWKLHLYRKIATFNVMLDKSKAPISFFAKFAPMTYK